MEKKVAFPKMRLFQVCYNYVLHTLRVFGRNCGIHFPHQPIEMNALNIIIANLRLWL